MNSILQDLYDRALFPAEEIVPTDPDYRPTLEKIRVEREYLASLLLDEEANRLQRMDELYNDVLDMICFAGFCYGTRFGARLAAELLPWRKRNA